LIALNLLSFLTVYVFLEPRKLERMRIAMRDEVRIQISGVRQDFEAVAAAAAAGAVAAEDEEEQVFVRRREVGRERGERRMKEEEVAENKEEEKTKAQQQQQEEEIKEKQGIGEERRKEGQRYGDASVKERKEDSPSSPTMLKQFTRAEVAALTAAAAARELLRRSRDGGEDEASEASGARELVRIDGNDPRMIPTPTPTPTHSPLSTSPSPPQDDISQNIIVRENDPNSPPAASHHPANLQRSTATPPNERRHSYVIEDNMVKLILAVDALTRTVKDVARRLDSIEGQLESVRESEKRRRRGTLRELWTAIPPLQSGWKQWVVSPTTRSGEWIKRQWQRVARFERENWAKSKTVVRQWNAGIWKGVAGGTGKAVGWLRRTVEKAKVDTTGPRIESSSRREGGEGERGGGEEKAANMARGSEIKQPE